MSYLRKLTNGMTISHLEHEQDIHEVRSFISELTQNDQSVSNCVIFNILFKSTNRFFVVKDQILNKVVGFAAIYYLDKITGRTVAQIEDVIIHPDYREEGIGQSLIEFCMDYVQDQRSCYKIVLNCEKHNIPFYEKCGFKLSEVQMRKNI